MIISVINHTNGQISDEQLEVAIRAINRLKKPAAAAAPPPPPRQEVLLQEIRDLLAKR